MNKTIIVIIFFYIQEKKKYGYMDMCQILFFNYALKNNIIFLELNGKNRNSDYPLLKVIDS